MLKKLKSKILILRATTNNSANKMMKRTQSLHHLVLNDDEFEFELQRTGFLRCNSMQFALSSGVLQLTSSLQNVLAASDIDNFENGEKLVTNLKYSIQNKYIYMPEPVVELLAYMFYVNYMYEEELNIDSLFKFYNVQNIATENLARKNLQRLWNDPLGVHDFFKPTVLQNIPGLNRYIIENQLDPILVQPSIPLTAPPNENMQQILKYIKAPDLMNMKRALYYPYAEVINDEILKPEKIASAMEVGDLSHIKYALRKNKITLLTIAKSAAFNGHVHILKYIYDYMPEYNLSQFVHDAIINNQIGSFHFIFKTYTFQPYMLVRLNHFVSPAFRKIMYEVIKDKNRNNLTI